MNEYLDLLTVSKNDQVEEYSVNDICADMVKIIKNRIKTLKYKQVNTDRVYEVPKSLYKLPKINEETSMNTKWEQFAAKKGIKKRKGYLVYDEELKKYIPRFGPYSKKNLIIRTGVLDGDKNFDQLAIEKLDRIKRNNEQRAANKHRKRK